MHRFVFLTMVTVTIGFVHSQASAQVINGCIKGNGTLKIVASPGGCANNETPI